LLIKWLGDKDSVVRRKTVQLIGKATNHGEWHWEIIAVKTDPNYEVEFREAMAITIPSLNMLLEDWDENVRRETVRQCGNLANHSEWKLDDIATQLMRTMKSSFVKPSQARSHRSLNHLKTGTALFERRLLS
jgi:hypothetical protein